MGRLLKIGDRVLVESRGGHNSEHRWYSADRTVYPGEYIITDVDYEKNNNEVGYTIKINNNSFRSNYVKFIDSEQEREFDSIMKIIYAD